MLLINSSVIIIIIQLVSDRTTTRTQISWLNLVLFLLHQTDFQGLERTESCLNLSSGANSNLLGAKS